MGPRGDSVKSCERSSCSKEFQPRKPNQRFCSTRCQEAAWRERNRRAIVHVDRLGHDRWIADEARWELIRPGDPRWT
jgi:hypothetical protein